MKKFSLIFITLIALAVSVFALTTSAQATDDKCYAHVVDKPAYDETISDAHWQRYSWTGGPHASDDAPAFPSSDWQANVQGDPHQIGVAGAYFRSNGNSGNGDWFYLEWVDAVVVHHDATYKDVEVACPTPSTRPPVDYKPAPKPSSGPFPVKVTEDPKKSTKVSLPNTGA